jgi:hypothetical protein
MNVPAIQQPIADLQALTSVVTQIKQGVESLAGRRGGALDRAVTLHDLVLLGLISEAEIMQVLK